MSKKTLYMETTEVPVERTVGAVSSALVQSGATQISTTYAGGKIVGLRWIMRVNGVDALFEMPARVYPIYRLLRMRQGYKIEPLMPQDFVPSQLKLWEKSERVAWRQLLRWVQAQVAMIETEMVQPLEVFTAYLILPGTNQTLFQKMMDTQFKMLPAPEKPQ